MKRSVKDWAATGETVANDIDNASAIAGIRRSTFRDDRSCFTIKARTPMTIIRPIAGRGMRVISPKSANPRQQKGGLGQGLGQGLDQGLDQGT
ncbi:hypothetical protein BwSH20_08130 [Bradyrhizobium ottawaense]|nr:hypothetical protein BwSH14_25870 [Bradyrhizobium ottawaense]GMO94062.1 hypothetical protein BwSH20_08130 [Bradyrhizobium ottawaense]